MAKYCMNCGNKISYGNTAFEFTYSKGRMCSGCKKEAVDITNGLVMDLERLNKSDLTQDDAENIISEYMHRIEGSNYTTEVKECLRKEVEGMLNLDYGVADDFEDDFWKLFLGGEKPNNETIKAIKEVEQMKINPAYGKTYDTVEEMMRDLKK